MSGVRVLVGTRKGAFILTSDGKRENWDVSGPHFAGWEIYHLKGSPVDPNRLYASQSSGWFGQVIQCSDDGGKTWEPVGQQVRLRRRPWHAPMVRRHAAPLGVQARLATSSRRLTDPDTVYAGVEDAALFRSTDGGQTWQELPGLREAKGHLWQPGAGGMCLHTILQDPSNPKRIVHRHLGRGRFPHRRRRQDLAADQPRPDIPLRAA